MLTHLSHTRWLPPGQTMHKPPLILKSYTIPRIWDELAQSAEFERRRADIDAFNAAHKWTKRGICMTPMRYYHSHSFNAGTTCLVSVHGEDGTVEVIDQSPGPFSAFSSPCAPLEA